ncbi:glycosyltransferase family 9 protein [Mycobacterium sp. 050128]|uniref:glycosyltransferase family 9 protein n=1 Tax=Mycobacterium sp. 050128 TaxID=3096112 RepID=UPI002EDB97AD
MDGRLSERVAHDDEQWADVEPGTLSRLLRARRPALYFTANIGDSVMTLPTVRALGAMFDAPLTVLSTKVSFDLCFREVSPRLVDITGVPETGPTALPVRSPDYAALAAQLGPVDVLINAVSTNLPMDTFRDLQRRLAPTTTIGFAGNYAEYDVTVPKQAWHACDLLFKLARLFDRSLRIEDFAQPVSIPSSVQERARSMRAAVPPGTKVLVVHADTDWKEKRWPVTRFIDLLNRFLSSRPDFVAWVVGMGHEDLNVGRERDRVISHLGLPLDLSMSMVAHADLFLGIDSCMLHAADLARVPGVGLFGATRSLTWGFRFGPHRHLDQRRMADISVEEVFAALEDIADEHV